MYSCKDCRASSSPVSELSMPSGPGWCRRARCCGYWGPNSRALRVDLAVCCAEVGVPCGEQLGPCVRSGAYATALNLATWQLARALASRASLLRQPSVSTARLNVADPNGEWRSESFNNFARFCLCLEREEMEDGQDATALVSPQASVLCAGALPKTCWLA